MGGAKLFAYYRTSTSWGKTQMREPNKGAETIYKI